MTEAAPPGPSPRARGRFRLSRRAMLAMGVLLTLLGLFVIGGTVPTAAGTLERSLGITGIAAFALWVGGILLGAGGRR